MAIDPPEDGEKQNKFDDFTPEGEALGYISQDQATVLAIQYAQDNPGEYGRRYRSRNMVWEVLSVEEGEDYYHIRLSYRPAGRFSRTPSVSAYAATLSLAFAAARFTLAVNRSSGRS